MTALEEYTAHHPDSVQEIMYSWPWRRFEGMFKRHLLRKAREELREMRDMRMVAMDSNPNYDSEENRNSKQQRTEQLQEAFDTAVRMLYGAPGSLPPDDPYDQDPLFAPLRSKAQSARGEADTPLVPQAGMGRDLLEAVG